MARLKGKFLIGAIGNLTFKKHRKEQIVQTKPGKGGVKQTKETKKAALVFGKASRFSNCLRQSFGFLIEDRYDGGMVNRLNKENFAIFKQCYQPETESYEFKPDSFRRLNGFDFNTKSPLKDSLWVEPSVQLVGQELQIRIPDFEIPSDFKFPPHSNICSVELSIYLLSIETCYQQQIRLEALQISNAQKMVPSREWKIEIPDGCICVTGLALHYYRNQGNLTVPVNHKEFNPAVIVNATVSNGKFNLPWDVSWHYAAIRFRPKNQDDLSNQETTSE
ncbi:hypothetical protein [Pedobacter steynii]|uniref:Uncharacterized protein n=1 Tax=Pedobacter steynii TaxID=430522 RepID=A0A1D7QK81_9SPHI|nr:hypothetical protein [Pedobacter steynii]AOM79091.1 hypothetical protein BFS30_19100 [Pedobacter steynii]